MMKQRRCGVLFDVGYGLCDETRRLGVALDALSGAMAARGIHKSSTELGALYRGVCARPEVGRRSLLELTIIAAGVEERLAKQIRGTVRWDAAPLDLLPGAIEALRDLRAAGLRVGVLANQPPSAAQDLVRLGVTELLDGLWLSEVVGLHKPDPAFFQLALEAWDLPADRVAYVGDRPDNDVAAAKRLGMHAVRLMVGPHVRQRAIGEAERADYEAASLVDAAQHLVAWTEKDV